jgi:hypothetical protein
LEGWDKEGTPHSYYLYVKAPERKRLIIDGLRFVGV